jgi:hypothetical protein
LFAVGALGIYLTLHGAEPEDKSTGRTLTTVILSGAVSFVAGLKAGKAAKL